MKQIETLVGIDVGQTGAIASYNKTEKSVKVINFPLSIEDVRDYLNDLRKQTDSMLVCIEQVSLWGNDFSNTGKTFRTQKMVKLYDDATAVLRLYEFPHVRVTPLEWQTFLNLKEINDEKYYYRKKRLYEAAKYYWNTFVFSKEQADAMLLLYFLMKKFEYDQEWIAKKIPQSVMEKLL